MRIWVLVTFHVCKRDIDLAKGRSEMTTRDWLKCKPSISMRAILATMAILLSFYSASANAQTLGEIFGRVNQIFNKLDNVQTVVGSVNSKVGDVQTKVGDVQEKVVTVHSGVVDGLNAVTGDMRDRLTESLNGAQRTLDEIIAGRDAFLDPGCGAGTPCGNFRADMLAFLTNLQALSNGLVDIAIGGAPFDFESSYGRIWCLNI